MTTIFRHGPTFAVIACLAVAGHAAGAAPAGPGYVAIELSGLPGGWITHPRAINEAGRVAGDANGDIGDHYPLAVVWDGPGVPTILTGLGGSVSRANALDEAGAVVGVTDEFARAFLWDGTDVIDLGPFQLFASSSAMAINEHGLIVGASDGSGGSIVAAVWRDGTLEELPALPGCCSAALDVNDAGVIVGQSTNEDNRTVAVRWAEDGPTVVADFGGVHASSHDVNAAGTIVGEAWLSQEPGGPFISKAFVHQAGVTTQLPDLGGWTSRALATTETGLIVGACTTPTNRLRAVIWRDGIVGNLNDLVVAGATDLTLAEATDVNESGVIVGITTDHRGFRLHPIDLDGDGAVAFGDLIIVLGAWGPCPAGSACPADLDASGSVGIADLLLLLASWS
jgi:uncharacterized membrane protein